MTRLWGGQISAIVADAMLIPGLPKSPAKNLQMMRAAMPLETPAPSVNRANMGKQTMYTALRPNVSLDGEPRMDPNARPRL